MANKRIQKLVTYSPKLFELATQRAQELGLSFNEYQRYVMAKDIDERSIPMVDEETEKRIEESLKDYAEGRYITVDPSIPGELEKALGL